VSYSNEQYDEARAFFTRAQKRFPSFIIPTDALTYDLARLIAEAEERGRRAANRSHR